MSRRGEYGRDPDPGLLDQWMERESRSRWSSRDRTSPPRSLGGKRTSLDKTGGDRVCAGRQDRPRQRAATAGGNHRAGTARAPSTASSGRSSVAANMTRPVQAHRQGRAGDDPCLPQPLSWIAERQAVQGPAMPPTSPPVRWLAGIAGCLPVAAAAEANDLSWRVPPRARFMRLLTCAESPPIDNMSGLTIAKSTGAITTAAKEIAISTRPVAGPRSRPRACRRRFRAWRN